MNALIIMIAVLFIVHVYETVFLVKEAETEKVQRAQTEKAKAEAESAKRESRRQDALVSKHGQGR